ncbi:MAG: hypothetical protein GX548_12430 [Lentisphaerae bacterium]|nr:hypothetical protein [Lentisphaerota bacterium]
MKTGGIRQVVIGAGLLGCALGASGRSLPVYREYTRPIVFYDDMGRRTEFDGIAPDVAARQMLRDAPAQESLLGKETILEMTMQSGGMAFGAKSSPAPMPVPSGEGERRREGEDTGRNWLLHSLTLPSLGQASSNVAQSAIRQEGESSWGWLADEISGKGETDVRGWLDGEDEQMELETAARDAVNPFGDDRQAQPTELSGENLPEAGDMPAWDERAGAMPERTAEWVSAPGGDVSGPGDRVVEAPRRWGASAGVAEMTQTRRILTGPASVPRAEAFGFGGAADKGESSERGMDWPSGRTLGMGGASSSQSTAVPAWGGLGMRSMTQPDGIGGGAGAGAGAGGRATWQGGWKLGGGDSRTTFRLEGLPSPVPTGRETAPAREMPRAGSGSGARPGWY